MELVGQRRDVALVMVEHGLSERHACKLLEVDRASYRYEPQRADDLIRRAHLTLLSEIEAENEGPGSWHEVT